MAVITSVPNDIDLATNIFWVNDVFNGNFKIGVRHTDYHIPPSQGGPTITTSYKVLNTLVTGHGEHFSKASFNNLPTQDQVSVAQAIASNYKLSVDTSSLSYGGINAIGYDLNHIATTSEAGPVAYTIVDNTAGTVPFSNIISLAANYTESTTTTTTSGYSNTTTVKVGGKIGFPAIGIDIAPEISNATTFDTPLAKAERILLESKGSIISRSSLLDLDVRLSPHPAPDILSFR